jgi:enamine deaminase RidA (YjgF/YER057c/UK114 family)
MVTTMNTLCISPFTIISDIRQKSDVWTKHYITISLNEAVYDTLKLEKVFSKLFEYIKNDNLLILQEKIYGLFSDRKKIISVRNNIKIDEKSIAPITFIEGAPCIGGMLAGIHIIAISFDPAKADVKAIEYNKKPVGKIFETKAFKEIFLSGISDYKKSDSPKEQASFMFYKVKKILEKEGCDIDKIIRTWIYFPRLLDWYDDFNEARTECFKKFGLISDDTSYLPASTGIQGKRFDKEECFMDVFAFIPKDNTQKISIMKNIRQNEAYEYGSSFSRGMKISDGKISQLHISGTASIDTAGKTIYEGDIQGQIIETLLNIASLLEKENSHLKNITIATVYCKNTEVYEKAKKMIKSFDLESIPFIFVFADVCREELLFEIDAIAIN